MLVMERVGESWPHAKRFARVCQYDEVADSADVTSMWRPAST